MVRSESYFSFIHNFLSWISFFSLQHFNIYWNMHENRTWKIPREYLIYISVEIRLIHIYYKIYMCLRFFFPLFHPYFVLFPIVKIQCTCTIFFLSECGFCQCQCIHNFTLYLCDFQFENMQHFIHVCNWAKVPTINILVGCDNSQNYFQ